LRSRGTGSSPVLDLGGRFVCAGFNDAHVHLVGGGFSLGRVELRGATTLEELRDRVAGGASRLAEGAWIEGRGWDQTQLPGGDYPPLGLLDEASGGRPAFLFRTDGHTAWANSAALAAAGIGPDTANPPGGEIVRGPDGAATGILKESAATLVERVIPRPGPAEQRAAVLSALAEFRRLGITSVSEFSPPGAARVYSELMQEGRLTARISVWAALTDDIEAAESIRDLFLPDNLYLRCTTLKAYLDGTLGAHTAALVQPYADAAGELGLAQIAEEPLRRLVRRAHRAGFQVALHAIGDRATKLALDAIEHIGQDVRARRHRIEHAEVVDPNDIPRFVAAGVVASMQPSQLISDLRWLVERLGRDRLAEAFPWRRLADSGARVIFGSDWPVEPLNPMLGLFGATATLAAEGLPSLGLRAEAQFGAEEALAAYTAGPAWATFEEALKGTVIAGHLADLAVLTGDPTRVPAEEIPSLAVDFTIFDGKVVYSREGAGSEA
jgi:predicted amidohydrolase YtcJ